jgi:hypothetical protein
MGKSWSVVFTLQTVAVVVLLLAVAYLFAQIAHYAGLPPAASIVLVGIAAGGMLPSDLHIALTPAVLALFLPALIFEGAWSIEAGALRRAAWAIVVLAVPGVVFTAALVASASLLGGAGIALPAALALGAILAATDPVAVLSLFRALNVPLDLLTIVEGESIANDGVAAVLSQAVVASTVATGAFTLLGSVEAFAYQSLAGIAIGLVIAAIGTPLLRRFRTPWIGIVTTLAVAYGSYALGSLASASGIFASAAAGIALPTLAFDKSEVRAIERFWDVRCEFDRVLTCRLESAARSHLPRTGAVACRRDRRRRLACDSRVRVRAAAWRRRRAAELAPRDRARRRPRRPLARARARLARIVSRPLARDRCRVRRGVPHARDPRLGARAAPAPPSAPRSRAPGGDLRGTTSERIIRSAATRGESCLLRYLGPKLRCNPCSCSKSPSSFSRSWHSCCSISTLARAIGSSRWSTTCSG